MTQPAGSDDAPGDRGAGSRRRSDLGSRRVVWTAFGISSVLHVLVIMVYPALMHLEVANPVPFLMPNTAEPVSGMEVIELVDIAPEEDAERPEEPDLVEEVSVSEVAATGPEVPGFEGPVLIAPGPTAAERLRPHLEDERIWRPVAPSRVALSLEQRLDLDLAAGILEYQDSVFAAIAQGAAGNDWTFTDSEGRRWGVSSGAIHLGDITIPLPNFTLGSNNPLEEREVMQIWEEMQRQAARAVIQDSWKERAQAIRARRDRERARPDTIGRLP